MAIPVPFRLTFWGLPLALSVILKMPDCMPAAPGLKVTLIVQLAPEATLLPQVFVWLNGPVTEILLMSKIPRPVLVSLTGCAGLLVNTTWSGKVRLVGESVTAGDTPTPVNGSACGLLGALSVTLTVPVRVPVAEGLNVTVILQLPLGGTDVQLLVWAKSLLFGPLTLIDVIVSVSSPL